MDMHPHLERIMAQTMEALGWLSIKLSENLPEELKAALLRLDDVCGATDGGVWVHCDEFRTTLDHRFPGVPSLSGNKISFERINDRGVLVVDPHQYGFNLDERQVIDLEFVEKVRLGFSEHY